MKSRSIWIGLILFLCAAGKAAAQKSSGEVLGTITDPSGAVVSGVAVTLTNTQTNEVRRINSDNNGNYRFVFVQPGIYSLKAELVSFRTSTINDLVLRVDEQRRQDIVLQVGEVTQTVNVEANPVAVNAETASLGNVIEERRIVELPLNGRSFLSLAYLSAGAVNPAVGNVESNATGLSGGRPGVAVAVSGMREGSNDILFDGIPSKHNFYAAVGTQPVLEGISEFKVQQGYFSPEYGLPAVVNVVTKSGTNVFHGAAWEFLRNDKLDARNAFAQGKGPNRQNQFGVAAGGPIVKDKVFVFGAYEGQRIRRTFTGERAIVPTPAMLNGDFSALLPATIIYDPLTYVPNTGTRRPFQGNVIPADRISPFAKTYNQFIPPPTPLTDGPFNRIGNTRFVQNDYKYDIRGDWNSSDRNKVFGRLSLSNSDQFGTSILPFNGSSSPFNTRNAVLAWTHVFSPNLVNDVRSGLDRAVLFTSTPEGAVSSPNWPVALGLKNLNQNPLCNGVTAVDLAGFGTFGFTFQNCVITLNNNYHFIDNLAYTRGRHNITLGGQVIRVQFRDIGAYQQSGSLTFTGQFSGHSVADYLLGAPFVAGGQNNAPAAYRRGTWWDAYVNDNFKLTKNLTLNFGLRYQYTQPLIEKYDHIGTFDFSTGKILLAGRDGVSRGLLTPDRNDFAPRFGFAWAPGGSQKWAIRSSYGIFYDRLPGNEWAFQRNFPPFIVGQTLVSDQNVPTIDISKLFPDVNVLDPNSYEGIALFVLSDRRSPYVQQWTLSMQRTLPGDLFLEGAYIGSKGTKLSKRVDSNVAPLPALNDTRPLEERRPYPRFSFILDDRGFSNSSYNGLQLTLRKVYSHGLTFQTSYTWSKALDNDSFDAKATRNYRLGDLDRGRSVFDIRHLFVYSMSYELPLGQNLKSGVARQVFHGWQVNSIFNLQSGTAFHVDTIADPSDTGAIFNHFPNRICNGNLPPDQRTRERWFDTGCFALPAFRTYGNAGVQYLDGPGYKNVDLSLNKNFPISESKNLQFRAEFFNAFNFVNLGRPDTTLESSSFGIISSAGLARAIQFGLKFIW